MLPTDPSSCHQFFRLWEDLYLDKNADVGVSWRKAGPFERFSEAILELDQVSPFVVNDFRGPKPPAKCRVGMSWKHDLRLFNLWSFWGTTIFGQPPYIHLAHPFTKNW